MRDKIVLLTGASEGIGKALACTLAGQGARLVLAARNRERLDDVVALCQDAGAEALAVPTDVADPDRCSALIDQAVEHFGGIDVLVNNAGIGMTNRFDEVEDLALFERLMQVNYLGAVYCTHHALPHLKRSKGLIAVVSSLQGRTGFPLCSGYAASKHAVQGFFDSLRIELWDDGVDVLVVSPGAVDTDIHARKLGGDGAVSHTGKDFSDKVQMPVDDCARLIAHSIASRQRDLIMTFGGKLAVWLKPFAPRFVDRLVARRLYAFYDIER